MPWQDKNQIISPAAAGFADTNPILLDAPTRPGPREAKDLTEAFFAGLQNSATGLALQRELPSRALAVNAPWYMRASAGVGNVAADLPLSIVGAVGGAAAGTGIAGPPGTVVGGFAGAMALPMSLRNALMTAYTQNHARTWSDVWEIAKAGALGFGEGAVIGAATGAAGKFAAPLTAGASSAVVRAGVPLAAEITALTTTAAALQGRAPTATEFLDNTILLGGLKAAVATGSPLAAKLRQIYAETGKTPAEVVADAARNPELKAYMEAVQTTKPGEAPPDLPPAYAKLAVEERVQAAFERDPRHEMLGKVFTDLMKDEKAGTAELFKDLPKAIDIEYVVDGDTAIAMTRAVDSLFGAEITAQTRGQVSVKATMQEAIRRHATDLDPHIVGEAEAGSTLAARFVMLRAAVDRAKEIGTEYAGKADADMTLNDRLRIAAAIERISTVQSSFMGARAEAGRALNMLWQLKYNKGIIGEVETLLKLYERKLPGQTDKWGHLSAALEMLNDPARLTTFARKFEKAGTTEQVLEAFKAGLVSGPLTHVANIAGNIGKLVTEAVEAPLATSLTALRQLAKGEPMPMEVYKAKALAPLQGLAWGWRDAFVYAAEAFKGEGAHLEKADVYRKAITWAPGGVDIGRIIRLPFRALQAGDVIFRTIAERGRAHELAVERALKEGFTPDTVEYNRRIGEYTFNPESGLPAETAAARMAEIQNAGAEAVFANRLGPTMEKIQHAIAGTWIGFIVPFIRTPANILSWAIQHTPGMNLLSARWRSDFAAGGAARDRAIARVVVGSGLTMLAWGLVKQGQLTGGMLFDPEQRRTKMGSGMQPYSIKIGDKWYSYQRLEPIGKVIGLVADLMEMREAQDQTEDAGKAAAAAVALMGNATISSTYLSGLAGLFNAMSDPTRYFETWYEQYAAALVPKILGQTAQMIDPEKREVDGAIQAIQSQIPFLREKLIPIRDVWGETRKNTRLAWVLPIATSEASHDKVKTEAERLKFAIADFPKYLYESGPFPGKERQIELTQEQRDIGRMATGKKALEILSPIVNDPKWDETPDFAKREAFRIVIEKARQVGREAALPGTAPEREALRKKIVDKIEEQVRAVEGKKPSAP